MRHSLGPPLRRATVGVLPLAPPWSPGGARAAGMPPAAEAHRLAFTPCLRATRHGGIDMSYVDADSAPDTYNSSRAEVRPPRGATVTYAPPHRGGNLRVGEHRRPKDNGRVLIAAPGGRDLSVRGGFDTLGSRTGKELRPRGFDIPGGASGRAGLVAHDGDRGRTGDSLMFSTGGRTAAALTNPVDPSDDVLNSTIREPGEAPAARVPAHADPLADDCDVFDQSGGLRHGGDQPTVRLVPHRDAAWAGALFVAVDTRKKQ